MRTYLVPKLYFQPSPQATTRQKAAVHFSSRSIGPHLDACEKIDAFASTRKSKPSSSGGSNDLSKMYLALIESKMSFTARIMKNHGLDAQNLQVLLDDACQGNVAKAYYWLHALDAGLISKAEFTQVLQGGVGQAHTTVIDITDKTQAEQRISARVKQLPPGLYTIGRSSENDIKLVESDSTHPRISSTHLVLLKTNNGKVYVLDTGSTNGTAISYPVYEADTGQGKELAVTGTTIRYHDGQHKNQLLPNQWQEVKPGHKIILDPHKSVEAHGAKWDQSVLAGARSRLADPACEEGLNDDELWSEDDALQTRLFKAGPANFTITF